MKAERAVVPASAPPGEPAAAGSSLQAQDPGALAAWSLGGTLGVAFPKSRSGSYTAALSLAKQAEQYAEGSVDGALLHLAGFGRSPAQAALALALVSYLRGIKGVQYFAGGSVVAYPHKATAVLECYLQASRCTDPRAHCVVVADEQQLLGTGGGVLSPRLAPQAQSPRLGSIEDLVASLQHRPAPSKQVLREFPCRYLLHRQFRYHPDHPASMADQIQAGAVREGCEWCPNFEIKDGDR